MADATRGPSAALLASSRCFAGKLELDRARSQLSDNYFNLASVSPRIGCQEGLCKYL